MAVALLRNFNSFNTPSRFRLTDLLKKFDKAFGATGRNYGHVGKGRTMSRRAEAARRQLDVPLRRRHVVPGPVDVRLHAARTSAAFPYGTQEGEISFCAYNTGVGWRQIVEKKHQTATLAQWYDKEGRHQIYTGGHAVPLASTDALARRCSGRPLGRDARTTSTWRAWRRRREKRSCGAGERARGEVEARSQKPEASSQKPEARRSDSSTGRSGDIPNRPVVLTGVTN